MAKKIVIKGEIKKKTHSPTRQELLAIKESLGRNYQRNQQRNCRRKLKKETVENLFIFLGADNTVWYLE